MSAYPRSRSGEMFMFMLTIFFLLAIIIIFSKLHAAFTTQNENEGVGTRQAALLHTYAMSEQMLLYIDEAAKFAAYESIATVMGHGGINPVTPKCPERYATYPQWTRPGDQQCFPDASVNGTVYDAFRKEMQVNLRKYLNYPGMPVVSYDILLDAGNGLTITGIAQDQLTLPIVSAKDARQQAITPYLQQDNVAGSLLEFTADTALQAQIKASVNRRQRTGNPTNITIHSTRTPDAVTALHQYDRGTISVHYLIDSNGALYQVLPEDQAAFLCDDCPRLEDRSIAIALVNPAPAVPVDGACATGELLRDEWCRDCAAACYEEYTPAQLEILEELLVDISKRQAIPAQNINLAGQLLATDNPGPALKSGANQRQWLAGLLVRVASGAAEHAEEYQDVAPESAGTYSIDGQVGVVLPLDDMTITSCYGHRSRNGGQLHYGVDFRAREPTPVRAIADGIITKQCDNCPGTTGFGLNTLIYHPNGMASHYSHLSSFSFRQGDAVKKGDIIGLSGNTGSSDAPHLHFAVFTSHVENPISTLASNPLCIFPDEQLKSIKIAANNCEYELTHTDPLLAQSCVGVQQMASVPTCGFNSVPLSAEGDAALTVTLDRIKKIEGLSQAIEQASQESLIDSRILIAQLVQESTGRHDIVTFDGGVGIAQFTDLDVSRESFQGIGDVSKIKRCICEGKKTCNVAETTCDRADPRLNPAMSVRAQARLLSKDANKYREYTDKIQFALAAYNAGNPNVDKAIKKAKEKGTKDPRWEDVSPHLPEITRSYVPSILRHYAAQGGVVATAFSDANCNQFNVKEMGTYSFAPSFSVTVPDLLTAVNRTVEWSQETYAACDGEGGMDTRACLRESVQEFNRQSEDLEITSCEEDAVRVLHSLQQAITDCSMNQQDACGCTWVPPPTENEVMIQLVDVRGINTPILYTAPSENTIMQTASFRNGGMNADAIVLTIGERNMVRISDADGSEAEEIAFETLSFEKAGRRIFLTLDDIQACGTYKTTHQLCAQVRQKIPVLSQGTELTRPQIKFALYLNDSSPPEAAQGIMATAAGGVSVTFMHSPSEDVSYYKVACAVTGEYGEEIFVNARQADGQGMVAEPLLAFFPTCNNQPVADTPFKIRVVPYDISGNAGAEAVYDSTIGSVVGVPIQS